MGLSTISPMIQYADAAHGKDLSAKACEALLNIPNPPAAVEEIIVNHCSEFISPPPAP